MKSVTFIKLALVCFVLSVFFLVNSIGSLTGSVVLVEFNEETSSILSGVFFIAGLLLYLLGREHAEMEKKVERLRKKVERLKRGK